MGDNPTFYKLKYRNSAFILCVYTSWCLYRYKKNVIVYMVSGLIIVDIKYLVIENQLTKNKKKNNYKDI